MLSEGARPRQLRWFHAGPMLFGDWGTSRLYVLGLAMFYAGHASFWFMLAMSCLLVGVAWAYQIICRLYPDGGGVYSSARHRSQTLAVVGALLLCADYIVTASLSALDAFHYVHLPHPEWWAAGAILLIGAVNYFGPTKVGTGALVVALATIGFSLVVAVAAAPSLGNAEIAHPVGSPIQWWRQFTALILAISGVEAVANMTGIMVKPVEQTARRAIWPVLTEIVVLNMVLTLAMLAVPAEVLGGGDPTQATVAHRDTMMRLLAEYYVGPGFATAASVVFALLLLSAVNTAVTDLVSIQFMMARDKELPRAMGGLNRWGMPVIPLWMATAAPVIIVLLAPDVGKLADLYAIGVVGAVALNLGSCSTYFGVSMRRYERVLMFLLAVLMVVIWVTIATEKPMALVFAMTVMGVGLAGRWTARHREQITQWATTAMPALAQATTAGAASLAAKAAALARRPQPTAPAKTRIMVATRGNPRLIHYAIEQCRLASGELLVLFVRHIAVPTMGSSRHADVSQDPEAVEMFAGIKEEADAAGVPVYFLYSVAYDVAEAILETAATYAVDTLLLGTTQRGMLWRAMKGDVIQQVATDLPERITLLVHAG
jgi:amino acid transporter/nucleotide-binding universal stress UspA family protein